MPGRPYRRPWFCLFLLSALGKGSNNGYVFMVYIKKKSKENLSNFKDEGIFLYNLGLKVENESMGHGSPLL